MDSYALCTLARKTTTFPTVYSPTHSTTTLFNLRATLKWWAWLKSSCPHHVSLQFIRLHYWPTQSNQETERYKRKKKKGIVNWQSFICVAAHEKYRRSWGKQLSFPLLPLSDHEYIILRYAFISGIVRRALLHFSKQPKSVLPSCSITKRSEKGTVEEKGKYAVH